MTQGLIFDIKKFALQDGPGIRTTVFFKGCPLSCAWCHNPEGIAHRAELMYDARKCIGCHHCATLCPQQRGEAPACIHCLRCADGCPASARRVAGRLVDDATVMQAICADRIFYEESSGGVTFSGGEPTQQPEFLLELLKACRCEGIHTAVDTCGYVASDLLMAVAAYTDLFLYDIKHWDAPAHKSATGVANDLILANLKMLAAAGKPLIIRLPLIAGVNDALATQTQIAAFLQTLPMIGAVSLLAYHPLGNHKLTQLGMMPRRAPDFNAPSPDRLEQIRALYANSGLNVTLGE